MILLQGNPCLGETLEQVDISCRTLHSLTNDIMWCTYCCDLCRLPVRTFWTANARHEYIKYMKHFVGREHPHIFVDLCHPVYSVPIRSFFSVYELRDCIDGKDNLVHRSDFTILTTDDSLWLENGERYLYGEGEIFITGWLFTASNVFPWWFITGGYISVTPENGKLVAWLLGV